MKKAIIESISRIPKNSEGNVINLIIIRTTDGKQPIVRKLSQFVTDLSNSGRLLGVDTDYVTSVEHPAIVEACTKLRGGEVQGDLTYKNEGDEYEVTEYSAAVTNKSHPLYGQVAVGDVAQLTKPVVVVEGFLYLEPSMKQSIVEEQAKALALQMSQMMGIFGTNSAGTGNAVEDVEEIDAETTTFIEAAGEAGEFTEEPVETA